MDPSFPIVKQTIKILNRQQNLDIESEKFQQRFQRVKKEKAREILENPEVDFQMYMHVIDQIMNEEK